MAAHSNFGGLFPNAGILLTAKSNQRALAYCAAAEKDERAGFVLTAALEWRLAAEAFAWDTDEADRCWINWERLMGLPRALARLIADDAPVTADLRFIPDNKVLAA
jgi:hypothetical protein